MKKLITKQRLFIILIVLVALAAIVPLASAEVEAQCTTGSSGFSDVPNSNVFCTNVRRLAQLSITFGCGSGLYCPNDFVTRGQMAAFMDRLSQANTTADIPFLFNLDHANTAAGDRIALIARSFSGPAASFESYGGANAWDGVVARTNSTSTTPAALFAINSGVGDGLEVSSGGLGLQVFAAKNGIQVDSSSTAYDTYGGWFSGPEGLYAQTELSGADGFVSRCESGGACWGIDSRGDSYGVYANTNSASNNYGVITNDNLFVGGTCTGCVVAHIVQNSGDSELNVGDLVAVNGIGPALANGSMPTMRVAKANGQNAGAIVGVVKETIEIEMVDKADVTYEAVEVANPRGEGTITEWQQVVSERQVPIHNTVARPAQPGDYVVIVVQGLAQVKAGDLNGSVEAGTQLASGETGVMRQADANGMILGVALEAPSTEGLAWAMIDIRR